MKAERSTVGEPPLPIMLKRIRRAHGPMIEEQVAKLVSKTGADAADACLEVMNNQPPSRLLTLPLGAEEQVAKLVSKTGADAADACLEVMNNQPPSRLLTLPLGAGVGNAPASSGNQIAQVA